VAVAPAKTMEPVVGPVSLRNSITNTPDFSAMLAALREQDEERAMSGVHGQNNRVSSLFDDGQFNVNHVAPLPDSNVFRIQQASAAQPVESTVFQFQR
jgi:hypothetical protein